MGKSPVIDTKTRILIVLMGALGDLTRGLCLVAHIKSHMPESKITWLVEPGCEQLARLHPQIDSVVVFNRPRHILAVWELYKTLSNQRFDITLDLQRHFKSGLFSMLSGAKRRIGFNRRNAKEFNWLFNNEHIDGFGNDLPKLDHYLKFTEYLGLPEPVSPDFGLSSFDLKTSAPKIAEQIKAPFVAVVMGSSWDSKDWLFDKYVQLVSNILSLKKMGVVLLGDHTKIATANSLFDKIQSSGIDSGLINLVGKTSLLDLISVLKEAAAGIGPDSGPGHLSGAVGTPYVSIFGPTLPKRVSPYGCEHLVVQANVSCAPCNKRVCPGLEKLCMQEISVEAVEEKLSHALAANNST